MKKTAGIISLGCPKNQVDCELMINKLQKAGYKITDDIEHSDVVVVNTCGFIESAKQEAIDNILYAAELKQHGRVKAVVVTGCLAQRYREQVMQLIPEADAVIGIGANADIAWVCDAALKGKRTESFPPVCEMPMNGERTLTTPPYFSYLRVADGCSNRCTYCAIPLIRGEFRSRKTEDIIAEAKTLAAQGVKEIAVIAQDTTKYGYDLYGCLMLPQLLKKLCEIDGIEWIRILYCYPDFITDELLETINSEEKICKYIDIPLQHADGKILRKMNRRGDRDSLMRLINNIREKIDGVTVRTTFITGFPGEGEDEFITLYDFVKEAAFDRMGCFAYSAEEDTEAAAMENQVDDETKQKRLDIIMRLQHDITCEKNEKRIGEICRVIVDGYDGYTDSYYGRSGSDAYEIDTQIYFTSAVELFNGEFVMVKITDTDEYDLIGEAVELL